MKGPSIRTLISIPLNSCPMGVQGTDSRQLDLIPHHLPAGSSPSSTNPASKWDRGRLAVGETVHSNQQSGRPGQPIHNSSYDRLSRFLLGLAICGSWFPWTMISLESSLMDSLLPI